MAENPNQRTAADLALRKGGGLEQRKTKCHALLDFHDNAVVGEPVFVATVVPEGSREYYYFEHDREMSA